MTAVLHIYSDESSVFDYKNNEFFIFAGLICFSTKQKKKYERMYSHVENTIRINCKYDVNKELKGSNISNKNKGKIYRSMNNWYKFCVLIKQRELRKEIFENKKHKQRYLDFAYKLVLKKCFEYLIRKKFINPDIVSDIFVNVDEHSTSTDGIYELRENLENEFKSGTFNFDWNIHYPPIFPKLRNLYLNYCDSKSKRLIRAADIISNHCYHLYKCTKSLNAISNMFIFELPKNKIICTGEEYFLNKQTIDNVK